MTPAELKAARSTLGLTVERFAETFGVAPGRTVRGWEAGERNGQPAAVPRPVVILVDLALSELIVRHRLGIVAPKENT